MTKFKNMKITQKDEITKQILKKKEIEQFQHFKTATSINP